MKILAKTALLICEQASYYKWNCILEQMDNFCAHNSKPIHLWQIKQFAFWFH